MKTQVTPELIKSVHASIARTKANTSQICGVYVSKPEPRFQQDPKRMDALRISLERGKQLLGGK